MQLHRNANEYYDYVTIRDISIEQDSSISKFIVNERFPYILPFKVTHNLKGIPVKNSIGRFLESTFDFDYTKDVTIKIIFDFVRSGKVITNNAELIYAPNLQKGLFRQID